MKFYKKIVLFFLIFASFQVCAQNTLDNLGLTSSTPASVAYSLRKLSSSYVSYAIQVRRSSDNATQDIGFTSGGDLDTSALLAFVGANNGYVSIWYDQSGYNRDMIKSDVNYQPQIVFSGAFKYIGTKVAIDFSGNKGIVYTGALSLASISTVIKSESATWPNYHTILGGSSRIGGILENVGTTFHSNVYPLAIWKDGFSKTTTETLSPVNQAMILSISPQIKNTSKIFIGNYDGGNGGGSILETEAIAFSTLNTSNVRLSMECNQGGYYGITMSSCTTTIVTNIATTNYYSCVGKIAAPLTIQGSGLNLTYQWYSNSSASTSDGTLISGAQSNSFIPPTTTVGTTYYYVIVSGSEGPSVVSDVSGAITVEDLSNMTISPSNPSINLGSSITLTASGASTYSWGDGLKTPLDQVSSCKLAVGLRLLKSTYAGSAIRLRRSSDNAEADFGFLGTELAVSVISSWLSGSTAYCVRLYDQSGNGNNMVPSSVSAQPLYVQSGLNGKPILRFNTSQNIKNSVNFTPPYTVVYAAKQTGPTRGRVLDGINNNWLLGWWGGNKSQAHYDGWVSNPGGTTSDNNSYVYSATGTGSVSAIFENGVTKTVYPSGGNSGPNGLRINEREASNADVADIFVFNTVLSTLNREAVEKSSSSYYGIYGLPMVAGATLTVSPTENTIYTVTGYSANEGCSVSSNVMVNVLKDPSLTNFDSKIKNYFDGSYAITPPTTLSTGIITYSSSNTAVATISGTTVSITGAGTATITATQTGDATYYSGSIASTLTVNSVAVITKNGQVSTTNANYINKNGAISDVFGLNKNGMIIQSKTYDLLTVLVMHLDAGNTSSYPGTGTTWADLSGLGNNGTLINNPTFNSSNGGNLVFNGSNTYVNAPLTKTASCTFSVWAKSINTNSNKMLFNAGNDGTGPDLFFSGGVLSWNTWDSSANPFGNIPATSANGNWHNYVVVNDAASTTAKLYYDGVLYGTAVYKNASANTKLYIGGTTGGYQWDGAIGNFQVHNRVLTSAEVVENFNNLKTRYGL